MKVALEIINGYRNDRGKQFEITRTEPDNITMGRSAAKSAQFGEEHAHVQISAEDLRLSRWHFMILVRPPNCYMCDMGSANHTYVNDFKRGSFIRDSVELRDGDIIMAGHTYLRAHITPGEPETPPVCVCAKCHRELKTIDGVPPDEIGASHFICEDCKRKQQGIPIQEGGGEEGQPVISVKCLNCGRDLVQQASGLWEAGLYLCRDCAMAERKERRRLREYVLLSQIGTGAMGMVHKAWHRPTGMVVALKEILPDKAMDERSLKTFHREISITHDLVHPNIVRFHDSFTRRRRPCLVTEYLPGGNAEDMLLKQKRPFTVEEALQIIIEFLEGLAYTHEKGVVHRDIKPQNILFDKDGHVKIADMSLAKSFELAGQSGITVPGEVGGTMIYMAPEQILDFRFVKPPADVYSTGVCLYYFITGKFPHDFPSELDLLLKRVGLDRDVRPPFSIVLEDEPIPVMERNPEIPKPLADVVDRCLRRNPEERFEDGRRLKEAIEEIFGT